MHTASKQTQTPCPLTPVPLPAVCLPASSRFDHRGHPVPPHLTPCGDKGDNPGGQQCYWLPGDSSVILETQMRTASKHMPCIPTSLTQAPLCLCPCCDPPSPSQVVTRGTKARAATTVTTDAAMAATTSSQGCATSGESKTSKPPLRPSHQPAAVDSALHPPLLPLLLPLSKQVEVLPRLWLRHLRPPLLRTLLPLLL
jgi:hypothetical protein